MAEPFLVGSSLNNVLPPRDRPPLPDRDARDYALMRFRAFLAALVYRRTGDPQQPPIPFRVPKANIHIYQPDDVENAAMPGFGLIPGRGIHETVGLGPPDAEESTANVYAPGTALIHQSDYVEVFTLEAWGSKQAERRALMAGVKSAMRQNDGSYAIRLSLPDYYDRVAEFSLDESTYIDGDEVVRNRRRAQLFIRLQVPEVALANFSTLQVQHITPSAQLGVEVLDGNVFPSIDCGEAPGTG